MGTSDSTGLRLAALLFAGIVIASASIAAEAPAGSSVAANVSDPKPAPAHPPLTLRPGDVVTFRLYGEEQEFSRKEVPIAPDGRVSYLEAQNIVAAGLTVDELRDRVNEELGKFRRAPHAYLVPVAYRSRKYLLIGQVARAGAFPLDRPMTLVDAIAQAGGVATPLRLNRPGLETADLSRSFVARGGRKLSVDFEQLFLHGDLSHNITLEPDDYIYIPSSEVGAVFVLGAVQAPGAQNFAEPTDAFEAIAARGGFTDRAWKQRVLVIRGSLGRSEIFIVNARTLLNARARVVPLQPRDIVFVSERPWSRSDEVLEAATAAFVASSIAGKTGAPAPSANATRPR